MATVRIFSYSKLVVAEIAATAGRPVTDGIFLLREPYLGNETLTPDTVTAATSQVATAAEETRILKVQVDPGQTVHYEVTPANQDLRTATSDSPKISGDELFNFGEGWRVSFLEAS